MQACYQWYVEQFPFLESEGQLNLTNINGIIPAVVFLALDLRMIFEADDTYEKITFSKSRPNPTLWNQIEQVLAKEIPNFTQHILSYLQWAYGENEEKQWDVGTRPPIGKYAPRPKRSSPGGNRDRGGNDRRPPKGGGDRQHGKRDNHRRPGKRYNDKKSTEAKEKVALAEVNSAVSKLNDQPDLSEVQLAPANSFFRRLQHKHAIAQGFESVSRGEGHDRSVVVVRSKET
ncbi:MAG: hypothetical protein HRU19_07470 [Pseudobacteriovorax sp.]|nr:hypothetical protein [Pseudobacteriovorax sp.]